MNKQSLILFSALSVCGFASADLIDRPGGIRVGQRMTIRPYVSLSYTWDSNVDSARNGGDGTSSWSVNPGASLKYRADNWSLNGSLDYRYHAYHDYSRNLNRSSLREQLSYRYSNSSAVEKGWSLMISESYALISQDDDMTNSDGRGIGRDRQQITLNASAEHRFNDRLHAGLTGSYYWLRYENDVDAYGPLYGWERWTAGANVGWAFSPWLDVFVSGHYSGYEQKNNRDLGWHNEPISDSRSIGRHSDSWSAHIGVGSRATERITYRVSGGVSGYRYGDGAYSDCSFVYSLSANWRISETLSMMALGSSHYQPGEREYGSSLKVYNLSLGLGKSLISGKLKATVDVSTRFEDRVYTAYEEDDYREDIYTGRLGLNYTLNRFFSVFGHLEYQTEKTHGNSTVARHYDYDRWRATLGLRLTY